MGSADDLLSEEDAKNAPREVMRLINRMMSGEGLVVVSNNYMFSVNANYSVA